MKYSLVGILGLIFFGVASAQDGSNTRDNTPKYSNEFLNIGVSARSLGMGYTAISFVDDVTAGYWNPAGLNKLKSDHELSLMHSSYFGGLANYDYAAFATSIDQESKIALSVIRFAVDDIPDTRFLVDVNGAINYDNIRFFSSADYGFLFSYARNLKKLGGIHVGGTLKIIHRTVGSFSKAWGFGLDVAAQKEVNDWKLGVVARDVLGTFNAWSHNAEEVEKVYALTGNDVPVNSIEITLPRVIIGASRAIEISEKFSALVSMDMEWTFDGKRNTLVRSNLVSMDPRLGMELNYNKLAFLRFGINQFQKIKDFDGSKSWTFQPNIGLGVSIKELTVDYALTDIGNLAPGLFSHVFSLKVNFNVEK